MPCGKDRLDALSHPSRGRAPAGLLLRWVTWSRTSEASPGLRHPPPPAPAFPRPRQSGSCSSLDASGGMCRWENDHRVRTWLARKKVLKMRSGRKTATRRTVTHVSLSTVLGRTHVLIKGPKCLKQRSDLRQFCDRHVFWIKAFMCNMLTSSVT